MPVSMVRRIVRLLVPAAIVLSTRVVGGLLLYHWLGLGSAESYWMKAAWGEGQNEVLRTSVESGFRWLYLFVGWDSAWYASIVAKGYMFSEQSFAFFPGLPLVGWLVAKVLGHPLLSTVVSSILFGLAWVPIYQLFFEGIVGRHAEGVEGTLLYAFTPVTYVFSTVAYGEGLFLFSTLGAWYSYRRNRVLPTVVLASLASLSRPTGILIFVPFLTGLVRAGKQRGSRLRRDLACLLAPFSSLLLWLFYCWRVSGDWMAPFNRTGWNDSPSLLARLMSILRNGVEGFSTLPAGLISLYGVFCAFILIVPIFFLRELYRLDVDLAVYSAIYLAGTMFFGNLFSAPRFLSFLFPFWIVAFERLKGLRHSTAWILLISTSSLLLAMFLWGSFLNGVFIS